MTTMLRIGSLQLESRYLLAPLAGYTNLSLRLAIRELGGLGLATTDLVNARALLVQSKKTLDLLRTCPEDRPVAVQIYGANADDLTAAARWLEAYGASSVDVNMGCPVHKVTRGGGGSALLCDAVNTVELVRKVVESVRIPVTVKMRLGWDADDLSAPHFAREFEKVGVAAVTIHGRTRAQGFSGAVNLDGIRAVVEAVERIPIIGNVYGTSKQIVNMLDQKDAAALKCMQVVFCYFGKEAGAGFLALLVSPARYRINSRDYQIIIVPTAPVPIGGGLLFVPAEVVQPTDLSVEGLMSIYVSMGITAGQFLSAESRPAPDQVAVS